MIGLYSCPAFLRGCYSRGEFIYQEDSEDAAVIRIDVVKDGRLTVPKE
jgi:hypothetical protein